MTPAEKFAKYAQATTGKPTPAEKFAAYVPTIPGRTTPQTPPPMLPNSAAQHGWSGDKPKTGRGRAALLTVAVLVLLGCGVIGAATITAISAPSPEGAAVTVPSASTGEKLGEAGGRAAATKATKAPVAAPPADPGVVPFKAGVSFRAGDFQITVHGKKCGIARVGSEYLNTKAQGSYCRVDMSAKNLTKSPHYYDTATALTALDGAGRKFHADSEAGIYGNEDGAGWFEEINPGNATRALVFFDLPKDAVLDRIEFSPGVFTLADTVTVKF